MPLTVAFDQPSNLVRVSAIDTSQEEAVQFPQVTSRATLPLPLLGLANTSISQQIRSSCEHTAMPTDMKPCRGQLKVRLSPLHTVSLPGEYQQRLQAFLDGKIYSPIQQWLEAVPRDEPWSRMRQFSIK
jgi:hypothetical protein